MTGFLVDVNVLIALTWPTHESHSRVGGLVFAPEFARRVKLL